MNGGHRPLPASPARRSNGPRGPVAAIVTMNVGLLVVLFFGPNSGRPNAILTGIGIAIVLAGLLLLLKFALDARRRRDSPPAAERR